MRPAIRRRQSRLHAWVDWATEAADVSAEIIALPAPGHDDRRVPQNATFFEN
jgi:hypothetical protein